MSDERALEDLTRKITEFRADVRDDFADIKLRLNDFVLREVYTSNREADQGRIKKLEDNASSDRKFRLALLVATIGAVAGAIASAVVNSGGVH